MKISAKHRILATIAVLFFVSGMARGGCNDASGNRYTLTIEGPEGDSVELGVTNSYTLTIRNYYTGVQLTPAQIDTSAITWVPGVFTVVDSNDDGDVNDDLHGITIKIFAGATAESSGETDWKTIICRYEPTGWYTWSNFQYSSGCQAKTKRLAIDTDWDGDFLTYLEEVMHGTSAFSADSDGDGLPDGYEVATSGLDPTNSSDGPGGLTDYLAAANDPDGDGKPDWYEIWIITNPDDYFD